MSRLMILKLAQTFTDETEHTQRLSSWMWETLVHFDRETKQAQEPKEGSRCPQTRPEDLDD